MARETPINRLGAALQFKLMEHVRARYTTSGLTDGAFAEEAGKELGFPVTKSNVLNAREALEIPSNVARLEVPSTEGLATKQDVTNILNEFHALNVRLDLLGRRLETYFNPGK